MGGQSSSKWATRDLKKLRSQKEECRKRPKIAKTGRIFVTLCFSQEIYTYIRYRYLKKKENRAVASTFFLFMKPEYVGYCNHPAARVS